MDITAVDCSLVHKVDDNVDINCQTIDGKNTLHAMARVLFQKRATDKASTRERIRRVPEKYMSCQMKLNLYNTNITICKTNSA